ncbi:MAG: hypothetical protein PHI98_11440 [Eubacteriales bacterium]|nr:hypothetical protein [Eubacteriales bacterium]
MELIDFDQRFSDYLNQWMEKNRANYKTPEEMEEQAPDVYLRFLNTPADWLNGKTPGEAFDDQQDAGELCKLLIRYITEEIPVPDPLLDRLLELGDEKAALELVTDATAPCEARMLMIDLLRQMESTAPMVDYIRWQVERNEEEEILDNALESLRLMGDKVVKPAKLAFNAAQAEGKEALLDVLCDYPGDEDVFHFALEQFKKTKDKRALYAGYLAKLEDDHALEALLEAAESEDVSYIDFIEIRSAIERLGSEAPIRDFSDDPTYKAVKRLQVK